jgi:predicted N-acetyltransferase YhbS
MLSFLQKSLIAPPSLWGRIKVAHMIEIVPLGTVDPAAVEILLDAAFGADRLGRTAYAMRVGTQMISNISFAALDTGELLGSLQCWPVGLEDHDGTLTPMTLVGPVAVSPDVQRGGIGKSLMQAMLVAAEREGHDALIMIGDPEYYDRFFGFNAELTQKWELPGPFERRRLLARVARLGGLPGIGRIIPHPSPEHGFASLALSA